MSAPQTLLVPLLVAVGAGLGAGLRFAVSRRLDGEWPWGTLAVNVAGSALVGALAALLDPAAAHERALALLVVGLCGGLTTCSGLAVQVHDLGWRRGTAYAVGTVLAAVGACAAAFALAS